MKMVCAWCNRKMGGKGTLRSHGICDRCFSQFMQSQFDFMQTLPVGIPTSLRTRSSNNHRAHPGEGKPPRASRSSI